jgi:hypothetical protein
VVLLSGENAPDGGTSCWGSGFLPTVYQGVEFRSKGDPVLFLTNPPGVRPEDRRGSLDVLREMNESHRAETGDPEIDTRIAAYELAFRMQTSVPDLTDVAQEPEAIEALYGVEPKQRGLLDSTLVVWGGEFGRTPMNEARNSSKFLGRDHHPRAFTVWMAGGGIKPGVTYGSTDELGYNPVEDPMSVHDLHATVLHCLGLDHTKLTFKFQGRDFRQARSRPRGAGMGETA